MVSMSALKASFESLGFQGVATYINSGNIIFKAKEGDARKLEKKIEEMLARAYQLECKVVVRTFPEMARLVESLPANWEAGSGWKYNVIFLRHSIDSEDILDSLEPERGIEQVAYLPGALLWSVRESDVTRSAMSKLSGKAIYRDMTVRNLNTTRKLYELMKTMSEP